MRHRNHAVIQGIVGLATVLAVLFGVLVVVPERSDAQTQYVVKQIWGKSGGLGNNPKDWLFAQSTSDQDNIGSHTASVLNLTSLPGYDATRWSTVTTPWEGDPGYPVANHFRKSFDLADYSIDLGQIRGIRVQFMYDDAAVLYLNGEEVYRTMRGNLDPTYSTYAKNDDIPYNPEIGSANGNENYYAAIPDIDGTNQCLNEPCPGPLPVAIDPNLLRSGENVFSASVWDNPQRSADSSFDLVFELELDETIEPSPVLINEIVASNDMSLEDAAGKTPDWIELRNTTSQAVSLAGWKLEDGTAGLEFPAGVSIPANGYLIVFADDSAVPIIDGEVHAGFKLSKDGDSLTLWDADGIRRDATGDFPQQITDVSYGRYNNGDSFGYMTTTTPRAANAARSTGLDPVVRPFPRRLFNVGEAVNLAVDAFDPDGTALSYQMTPAVPGVSLNTTTGEITGTASPAGEYTTTISVRDGAGAVTSFGAEFRYFPAPAGGASLVLSEYNAVAPDRPLGGDPDPVFGPVDGNGGDWYEFLVVEDNLDLRGWTIELWDRDRNSELLEMAAALTFTENPDLAGLPAGTLITISEDRADDVTFNPTEGDWHMNFQSNADLEGKYFTVDSQESFNSTRDDQNVIIRDAAGAMRSPLVGETEAWDYGIGGVSGSETMALCAVPTATAQVDPLADYQSSSTSSFGTPNICVYPDPSDPTTTITLRQDLAPLRASTSFGAGSGDANCTGASNNTDVRAILEYDVGLRDGLGYCPIVNRQTQVNTVAGDVDDDGAATLRDALIITQCTASSTANSYCASLR